MGAMVLTMVEKGYKDLYSAFDRPYNSRVRNLELPLNLTKLPDVIPKLEGLCRLSWNVDDYLYTSMPSCIGRLKNLQSLHLLGRHLMIALPDKIGQLEKLNELVVSAKILGARPIPPSWWKLTNIKRLVLDLEGVPYRLPSEIGNLTKLAELCLKGSSVELLPSSIGMLENLRSLSLHDTDRLVHIPLELGNLINLQSLEIAHSNSLPFCWQTWRLSNLSKNTSKKTKIAIPNKIYSLVSLTTLYIREFEEISPGIGRLLCCMDIVSLPESMQSLKNLRYLGLGDNRKLQSLPNWIYQLTNLKEMSLRHCDGFGGVAPCG
jgi:Leucine-rich repeat (LRR) protein